MNLPTVNLKVFMFKHFVRVKYSVFNIKCVGHFVKESHLKCETGHQIVGRLMLTSCFINCCNLK